MADHFIVIDPGMARILRAGRKRQMRAVAGSGSSHCRPGDRILLREAWIAGRIKDGREYGCAARIAEFAVFPDGWRQYFDGHGAPGQPPRDGRHAWVAALHMPRWAHRTALIVDAVRHQRLHDITTADLRAEGLKPILAGWRWCLPRPLPGLYRTGQEAFSAYWNTTHATDGERWEDNPRVAVVDFTLDTTP